VTFASTTIAAFSTLQLLDLGGDVGQLLLRVVGRQVDGDRRLLLGQRGELLVDLLDLLGRLVLGVDRDLDRRAQPRTTSLSSDLDQVTHLGSRLATAFVHACRPVDPLWCTTYTGCDRPGPAIARRRLFLPRPCACGRGCRARWCRPRSTPTAHPAATDDGDGVRATRVDLGRRAHPHRARPRAVCMCITPPLPTTSAADSSGEVVEAVNRRVDDLPREPSDALDDVSEWGGHHAWAPAAQAVPDQLNW
jgi:hypothetical protein